MSSPVLPHGPSAQVEDSFFKVDPAGLLERLAQALGAEGIAYCHWKGHRSWHRWARGGGDVHLLVARDSIIQFRSIIQGLGFKPCVPAGERQVPGLESYVGHDPGLQRPLRLRVYYRLLLGDYWRTTYFVPIEQAMLDDTVQGSPFRVPSAPYQLLTFVLRLVIRQGGLPLLDLRKRQLRGIQGHLDYLEGRCSREALSAMLRRHLPLIDPIFFERCLKSLRMELNFLQRAAVSRELHQRLRAYARRPPARALIIAAAENLLPERVRSILYELRLSPARGGVVVGLSGAGVEVTACVRQLEAWLSGDFPIMAAHFDRPPRSLLSKWLAAVRWLVEAVRKSAGTTLPGTKQLAWLSQICDARDRFLLYVRVRRFASKGGIAFCAQYPAIQHRIPPADAGPGAVGAALDRYSQSILSPDAILVVPAPANDSFEPGRPGAEVLNQLRAGIWSLL